MVARRGDDRDDDDHERAAPFVAGDVPQRVGDDEHGRPSKIHWSVWLVLVVPTVAVRRQRKVRSWGRSWESLERRRIIADGFLKADCDSTDNVADAEIADSRMVGGCALPSRYRWCFGYRGVSRYGWCRALAVASRLSRGVLPSRRYVTGGIARYGWCRTLPVTLVRYRRQSCVRYSFVTGGSRGMAADALPVAVAHPRGTVWKATGSSAKTSTIRRLPGYRR